MNLSILVLPALLGTLAASAVHTLPTDLRHDAAGKTPLTATRMAVARGAGSTCRLGCNEGNVGCEFVGEGATVSYGIDHNPHMECAFEWSSNTCDAGPDVMCYTEYRYRTRDCDTPPWYINRVTSSTCAKPIPVPIQPVE